MKKINFFLLKFLKKLTFLRVLKICGIVLIGFILLNVLGVFEHYLPGYYMVQNVTPQYAGDLRGKTRLEVLMWISTWKETPEYQWELNRSTSDIYHTNIPPRKEICLGKPWFYPYYESKDLIRVESADTDVLDFLEKKNGSKLWAISFSRNEENFWHQDYLHEYEERVRLLFQSKYWCVCSERFSVSPVRTALCLEFNEDNRVISQTKIDLSFIPSNFWSDVEMVLEVINPLSIWKEFLSCFRDKSD